MKKREEPKGYKLAAKDPNGYAHMSPEERFLLFIVPAMGAVHAAKCFSIDPERVKAEWGARYSDRLPVNLENK